MMHAFLRPVKVVVIVVVQKVFLLLLLRVLPEHKKALPQQKGPVIHLTSLDFVDFDEIFLLRRRRRRRRRSHPPRGLLAGSTQSYNSINHSRVTCVTCVCVCVFEIYFSYRFIFTNNNEKRTKKNISTKQNTKIFHTTKKDSK